MSIYNESLYNPLNCQKDIGHILLIDDAAYSGSRLANCFNYFRLIKQEQPSMSKNILNNAQFHVLVPFITKQALNVFQTNSALAGLSGEFFYIDVMEPCTTPNNNTLLSICMDDCAATYTYFDHKVPIGGTSTIPCLNKPWLLDGTYFTPESQKYNFASNTLIKRFSLSKQVIQNALLLDPVIPPYKITHFEKEQFEYAPLQVPGVKPKIS